MAQVHELRRDRLLFARRLRTEPLEPDHPAQLTGSGFADDPDQAVAAVAHLDGDQLAGGEGRLGHGPDDTRTSVLGVGRRLSESASALGLGGCRCEYSVFERPVASARRAWT